MASTVKLIGADRLRQRLEKGRRRGREAVAAAMAEALEFVEAKAREILDAEVYGTVDAEDIDPPDMSDGDSLYRSFIRDLVGTGRTAVTGRVLNTAEHAAFLEYGTDNEGTGTLFVAPKDAKALHWGGGGGGQPGFFSKGHEVSGITPIRFMQRALSENRGAVKAIFRKHLSGLFD